MPEMSRRNLLGAAVAAAAASQLPLARTAHAAIPQQALPGGRRRLRVQFVPGGHTTPLQIFSMFEDAAFQAFDTVVWPHPDPFRAALAEGGPDVIVTNDWITGGWPVRDRENITKYLDAGKGLVVLHHAVGSNNNEWPWWSEQVTGVMLWNPGVPNMKTQSRLKQFVVQRLEPVGDHPIVKDLTSFMLPWDETFPNMWLSPKITPLIESDDPDYVQPTVGWVGVHPKARVCCLQPGHTRYVCQDPNYRKIVRNMIAWCGGD
jgi:hypothetical protein